MCALAGGGVTLNGSVGDDLMAAGGGAAPGGFVYPTIINGRNVQSGVYLAKGATVAGDAYLVGGTGNVAGTVDGDLFTGMNELSLTGAVGGNATLYGNTIDVADNASVGGTLTYETAPESAGANIVPAGVAPQIIPIVRTPAPPQEEPLVTRMIWWTINLARVLLGLLALGAVLLAVFPGFTNGVAGELQREPWSALGYGFLVLLLFVPLTMILVLLAWLFWGVFPGAMAVAFFLLGLGGLVWMFSPAIAGFWLGQLLLRENSSKLLQLFVGGAIILLVAWAAGWIPIVGGWLGWLVLLCSWVLAAGAIITFYRQHRVGDISEHLPSPPASRHASCGHLDASVDCGIHLLGPMCRLQVQHGQCAIKLADRPVCSATAAWVSSKCPIVVRPVRLYSAKMNAAPVLPEAKENGL